MLTTNPPVPLLRSISGRLYAAVGVLCVALLATNAQTIIYSGTVAAGARAVEQESIDAMRAVDGFDELLDRYRRAVTANTDARAQQRPETSAELDEMDQRLATIPAEFSAKSLPATAVTERLAASTAELEKLAHAALGAAGRDDVEAPQSAQRFEDFTNIVEDDVAAWKAAMREATATELATMNDRATAMRRAYFMVIAGACLVGVAALLLSRAVLHRLRRLATVMLSLAAGDIAIEVPFRGERDEVGRLADALQVFRDQAGRVMASEANLHAALESMVEAIVISSADMQVVMHNQRLVTMFDLPKRDYVGMQTNELADHLISEQGWSSDIVAEMRQRLGAVRTHPQGSDTFEVDLPDLRSYALTAAVMANDNLLICVEDISERRRSAERIFHLAHHDVLTGLPNRAAFQERLGLAVDDATSTNGFAVTLLLCDLDHFKEVNDIFGHPAGDELLQQAAARIRETMRKTDVLARLGGDEFAIIHLTGSDPGEACALAERIVAALKQPFEVQDHRVSIGVSIGIASAPLDAASPVDLLKQADLALYAAKRAGRSMFVVYDRTMAERYAERRALEAEMRLSMDAGGFHVEYQPQIDLVTRRITGFEALARWHHPTRGDVPPSLFIPIAEESGLIIKLGEWILRRACADAAGWGTESSIAVNVAPQQFRQEGFIGQVLSALRDSGLPPDRLELEITETAMLTDGEHMLTVLNELKALGVKLAMDDFGTGYSALSYLQKFPFDKIKIDQSFIHELGDKDESDAIVRAVAALGKNLGLKTLAEGIETEQQASIIFDASCREAQGYLFGRPMPATEIVKLLEEQGGVHDTTDFEDYRSVA